MTARRMRSTLSRIATFLVVSSGLALPALSQSPFSVAVSVNDRIVTHYEVEQRTLFLQLLNAPGDLPQVARDTLVDERLQLDIGNRFGLSATAEQVEEGMEEFAGRANLDVGAFLAAIQQEGVAPETFRDFVGAGITWRNIVRARFGPRAQVSEDEIDRALALSATDGGAQVNVGELIIPLRGQDPDQVRALINELSESTDGSIGGFAAAARQYSGAPSARNGGGMGWRPLASIPPQLRALLLPLEIGGVTDPIPLGEAVGIFQLRGLEENGFVTPDLTALEYAEVLIPGGQSEAAQAAAEDLRNEIDTCDDLYGVRPGGFEIVTLPVADVPSDISVELARLDANEVSTSLTRADGTQLLFLMLCGRSTELPEGAREETRQALFQQRLQSYADGYLAELRADAIIEEYP